MKKATDYKVGDHFTMMGFSVPLVIVNITANRVVYINPVTESKEWMSIKQFKIIIGE